MKSINEIVAGQTFKNKKTGSFIVVRRDWTDYAKANGFVQIQKVDANGKPNGALYAPKFETFAKSYEFVK